LQPAEAAGGREGRLRGRGALLRRRPVYRVEKNNPAAVKIAKALYAEKCLDRHVSRDTSFGEVFDEIMAMA